MSNQQTQQDWRSNPAVVGLVHIFLLIVSQYKDGGSAGGSMRSSLHSSTDRAARVRGEMQVSHTRTKMGGQMLTGPRLSVHHE